MKDPKENNDIIPISNSDLDSEGIAIRNCYKGLYKKKPSLNKMLEFKKTWVLKIVFSFSLVFVKDPKENEDDIPKSESDSDLDSEGILQFKIVI